MFENPKSTKLLMLFSKGYCTLFKENDSREADVFIFKITVLLCGEIRIVLK